MADLRVSIADVEFKNPVIGASGAVGFGHEYNTVFPLKELGGISVKGLTLSPRKGNPSPRIAETPGGILNSVGLENPGVHEYLKTQLPFLKRYGIRIIANIAGNTFDEYREMASLVSSSDTDMIEMNISCPNVKEGGVAFGTNPKMVYDIVSAVRPAAKKPLIVKLSPNVADITEIAKAAEAAGADALSLINTLLGMKIDIKTKRPVLANVVGGLSGPAVKPVAVRMVWQVARATKLPIIGMGGIATAEDAVEFLLAGASAVMIGTAFFADPFAGIKVKRGLAEYIDSNGYKKVTELTGKVACD